MGRTIPSFRIILTTEKAEWKPFRNALDKKEMKEFDEMWDIPRLYVSACSNSVQLVPLQPIVMSILFQHYKELNKCIREVEALGEVGGETKVNNNGDKQQEQDQEEENNKEKEGVVPIVPINTTITTTIDSYFIKNANHHQEISL
jgi:hypothetical protein